MQEEIIEGLRLSPQQKRLWSLQQDDRLRSYRACCAILIKGPLRPDILGAALQSVVERYEVLRTVFQRLPGMTTPIQVVTQSSPVAPPDEYDLSGLEPHEQDKVVEKLFNEARRVPVDFEQGPLVYLSLIRLSPDEHQLLVSLPSLCADRAALGILLREISSAYEANVLGEQLPDGLIQYADLSEWQNELFEGEDTLAGREYWLRQDTSDWATLALPFKRQTRRQTGFEPLTQTLNLEATVSLQLKSLAARYGTSLQTVLVACWQILLWRLTGQPEMITGVYSDGRNYEELEDALGLFAKFLPLRGHLDEHTPLEELLRQLDESRRELSKWQDCFAWEQLVRANDGDAAASYFPACFEWNEQAAVSRAADLSFSIQKQYVCLDRFELKLTCSAREDELIAELHYDAGLFDPEEIARLCEQFQTLLSDAASRPHVSIGDLKILSDAARRQLLEEFNATATLYPADKCVHQLFEAAAERAGQATALICEDRELTYGELNARANKLAHHLRGLGVGPETLVGLCVERSAEMIIGMLGILKAGGAYVPLDPSYPSSRLKLILNDARPTVLLTQESAAAALPDYEGQCLRLDADWDTIEAESDENPIALATTENLAYVIYTSGSTGNPKGVAVEHRQLVNYLHAVLDKLALPWPAIFATASTFAADLGNTAIFPALCSGGCLNVILPERFSDPEALAEYLKRHPVDCLKIVPSHLAALLGSSNAPAAILPRERLILGGEASGWGLVEKLRTLAPACRILNHYGPTETTVGVLTYGVGEIPADPRSATLPLGHPIANTQVCLLDSNLQPVPVWATGEVYIGGLNVARGYHNSPAQTAEKFIPNPLTTQQGGRLYRTGDLARYLPGGSIEFLGRRDHQVKIRGFRIELGEIEAALAGHALVQQAIALVREDEAGDGRLVAYVVPAQETAPAVDDLRRWLDERLPHYMIPTAFLMLDDLPLMPNGKVDRRALPSPETTLGERDKLFVAPRTAIEEVIAGIWMEILHLDRVSINDNFFEIGGHSLLATQVISRVRAIFQVELPVRRLFEHPTLVELAETIETGLRGAEGLLAPPVRPVARDGGMPLSFAQQRLWFLDQLEPENPFYNMPAAVRFEGPLDTVALQSAFNEIIRRHEILRTTFSTVADRPLQFISPPAPLSLPVTDLSALPSLEERDRQLQLLASAEARLPFDLARGPLLRIRLLRLAPEEHALLLTIHHIVSDGWSIGVLVKEVSALYTAFAAGKPSPLPELPIQYADFAHWQREWLQGDVLDAQLSYWKEQLAGAPAVLELPTDRPRPAVQSHRGAREEMRMGSDVVQKLREVSREEGVTLFMTLVGVFQTLLWRYSGQEEVVVGTPIANRTRAEVEGLIGFFVNTLVMRTSMRGEPSFREMLRRVREVSLGAYAHQDVPFEMLVEELQPERDMSRTPLFQVMFALHNTPRQALDLDSQSLSLSLIPSTGSTAKFDLEVNFVESDGGLDASCEYNTDLFNSSTIKRFLAHFRNLLAAALSEPERPLSALSLLSEAERYQVLVEWNRTAEPFPTHLCFHQLFEEQARLTPDAMAVGASDSLPLSYGQLNERANQLAHLLRDEGLGPESVVALMLERGPELLTCILAIFKAGAAYLPLDTLHPSARVAQVIKQSQASLVIVSSALNERVTGALAHIDEAARPRVRVLEQTVSDISAEADSADGLRRRENLPTVSGPEHLAYLIYTSGSTGVPKGVMIEQRGMVNHLWAKVSALDMRAEDVVSQTASACFDISVWQMLAVLLVGGRVEFFSDEEAHDPERLAEAVESRRVSIAEVVPSMLRSMIEREREAAQREGRSAAERSGGEWAHVRWLLVTGEALGADLCRDWAAMYAGVRVMNAYGPTECSDDVTHHVVDELGADERDVPIGRAVSNIRLYVVDERGELVGVGIWGELLVGGIGVGRGYRGDGAKTAEVFVPDAYSGEAGGRVYRTGDVVRWRDVGVLEYAGRIDAQVKVRGYRIELGEIEARLAEQESVREAVVLVREDTPGDKRLVAYVVTEQANASSTQAALSTSALRGFLKERLPEYMVPAAFIMLDAMPLTPNGKIDRRALPAPDQTEREDTETYVAPRTPTEEILVGICAGIIGVERVGINDNFFEIGGHSLLATQIISRMREAFQIELPLRRIFEQPVIAALAASVDADLRTAHGLPSHAIEPVARSSGGAFPLSFAQRRLWFLDQLEPDSPAYNIPSAVGFSGRLNIPALEQTFNEVVRRHEALRTSFRIVDGEPVQLISEPLPVSLPTLDLRSLTESEREKETRRLIDEEARLPFDLANGPLLRVKLLKLDTDEHMLLFTMHHIISDGWSIGVLVKEVTALYAAYSAGEASPLAELAIQYADFAHWQHEWLQGDALNTQLAYWREQLEGAPAVLELPTDRPRPAVQTFRGAQHSFVVSKILKDELGELSRRERVTLYMTLLGAFQTLLYRYTGQTDLVVGSPIANRTRPEIESLIGFFVNTLVLRTSLSGEPSFRETLGRVREVALGAYAHQDAPFEMLVEELQPERSLSHTPLFQVAFALQNMPRKTREIGEQGLTLSLVETRSGTAKFDLTLFVIEEDEELLGRFEYNTDLFDAATIERMTGHFRLLLEGIVANPEQPLSRLPLLGEEERRQLLVEWNDTAVGEPQPTCIHHLFEAQAERTPQHLALASAEQQFTYQQLNNRANQLAHHLIALGAGPESLVAICLDRSIEMVVALLAVLKSGSAYVPLDPHYPRERLRWMLEDAQPRVVVTSRGVIERVGESESPVVLLDEQWAEVERQPEDNPIVEMVEENLAYVIYTSGSTGRPKGVETSHAGLFNLVTWHQRAYMPGPETRASQVAGQAFDASVWEIWPYLTAGSSLHIAEDDTVLSPQALWQWLQSNAITHCFLPTPLAEAVLPLVTLNGDAKDLKFLLTGGESLHQRPSREFGWSLVNHYGPTESSVVTTSAQVDAGQSVGAPPIGRPIDNAQVYVLDRQLQVVPVGVAGELYIGGNSLARGYLRRAETTAERFIPDSFSGKAGARLYKTGDIVRYLSDGNLEFIGRGDQQVKIRGYRIELGEIEAAVVAHPGVNEAVVVAREDVAGDKRLVAYVVQNPEGQDAPDQPTATTAHAEQVSQWQQLYEDTYSQPAPEQDSTFNIIGWNSSYTGQPIPPEEMREWVDSTVERILGLRPESVLEIGCGTGLLTLRLAPHCRRYVGTDFSQQAISYLQDQISLPGRELPQVTLRQQMADNFEGLEGETFDTIILNSVIQYFPDIDYLLKVLEVAVKSVSPGGRIFLGDVRSLPLLQAFHAAVQLYQSEPSLPSAQLRQRIDKQFADEEELVIDPAFFPALKQHLPQIGFIQIQHKRGRHHNELTQFRYDVTLHVRPEQTPALNEHWLDWRTEELSLPALRGLLAESPAEAIALRHVPNARLSTAIRTLELLASEEPPATAGELRESLRDTSAVNAIDPEELWSLSDSLAYTAEIGWSGPGADDCFDVLFRRRQGLNDDESRTDALIALPALSSTAQMNVKPWGQYANNPLGKIARRNLLPQLRQYLKEKLPEYMVPAAFVVMDKLPLTPNGKVDRQKLPVPEQTRAGLAEGFVAARTPVEEILAGIYADILNVDYVGIHDSFFDLGGHSLLATQLISRVCNAFQIDIPLRHLFESPTIAGLASSIEMIIRAGQGRLAPALERVSRDAPLPVSFAQQRLWFLEQLFPGNSSYHIPAIVRLTGQLDIPALEQTFNEIVRRHEVLRTTFKVVNGSSMQFVSPPQTLTVPVQDLQQLTATALESETRRLIAEEVKTPFNLAEGPLLRARLLRHAPQEHVLLVTMHHIASDGWSIGVLIREVSTLYAAYTRGEASPLAELPIQYADFAHWQREWLQGEVLEAQLSYWREQLAGAPVTTEIPTDRPRPPMQSSRGATEPVTLSAAVAEGLKALSREQGTTLFMTLLAAWQALLARYSGQEDVVVGTPIANRTRAELEDLIGFFVNTLVLRTSLRGEPSFRELLTRVREVALGAYAHQDVPFEMLVEGLQQSRDMSRSPLFQIMFILQNMPGEELELPGLKLSRAGAESTAAMFDLTLSLEEKHGVISGSLNYNTDLYDRGTILRILSSFKILLDGFVAHPDQSISSVPLLSASDLHQLLYLWNDTAAPFSDLCIHEMFERQAERTPDAVALLFADESLTYAELNRRANQLAHYLRRLSVGPDVLVAVMLERSLEMIVTLLGILKAGGAYVPLDPQYPQERLTYMLEDAQAQVLVTHSSLLGYVSGQTPNTVCVDTEWEEIAAQSGENVDEAGASGVTPQNLSYVIYTSGSTGKPKGVGITHHSATTMVQWAGREFSPAELSGVLACTSICFDLSIFEMFVPLSFGGKVIVVENALMLKELKVAEEVTLINTVPSVGAELIRSRAVPPSVRVMNLAGEALGRKLVEEVYEGSGVERVMNLYGPTEDTTYTTSGEMKRGEVGATTIGRPISNTAIYILDRELMAVPVGVSGEIYIGGEGLARGYMRRAEATAERFVPNPFSEEGGGRMYRTGDMGRYRADGEIEYLGRGDNQVKVRGYRIELGEIEAVMVKHPLVREAVVEVREDHRSERRLVAYVVWEDDATEGAERKSALRQFLRGKLPEYMVPGIFVEMEQMPLTPSGKVDRKKLEWREDERGGEARALTGPRSAMEKKIAGVWASVLGVEQVGVDENFFDIGGHSLLMVEVHSRMEAEVGAKVSMMELFQYPTIEALAKHLSKEQEEAPAFQQGQERAETRRELRKRRRQVR